MLKSTVLMFIAVLTLSCLAFAQKRTQREALEQGLTPQGDATTTCQVTYTSGSGVNATKFCVTKNGNITEFSRNGLEMINVGIVGEGYGMCDASNSNTQYYDYGYEDTPNWLAPTFTHSGNTVTVTRATSDGLWQLTQTIVNIPATPLGPASAQVTMAWKNLSGVARSIQMVRYVDVDVSNNHIDNEQNDFDYTSNTVYGIGVDPYDGFTSGLGLTNNTFSTAGYQVYALPSYDAPDPCGHNGVAVHPYTGDGAIFAQWQQTVKAKATVTVISTYKPI